MFTKCNLLQPQDFPKLSRGLIKLRVYENLEISDDTIDVFLTWMFDYSWDTLLKFYIYKNNGLKRIPTGLSKLNKLAFFRIDDNTLEPGIVKKGSLKFSDNTLVVYHSNCGIHTVEADAFQGIRYFKCFY